MSVQKYPSTPHLPWSPGLQNDDRRIESLDGLIGREVVVTEKLDGENTTIMSDRVHARSLDSRNHPSRNWVKAFAGDIQWRLVPNWRICGENVYAKHSIYYDNLESYFYGFSIWSPNDISRPWDETVNTFVNFGIVPAPVLWRGTFDEKKLRELSDSLDTEKIEGFVVRVVGEIPVADFGRLVAKWVRKGHVQTDEHWMTAPIIPNKLASTL